LYESDPFGEGLRTLSQQGWSTNANLLRDSIGHKYCSTHLLAQNPISILKGDCDMPDNGSINEGTTGTTGTGVGAGAGTATGLSNTTHDYKEKISDAATYARDYVSDKVSVVGDKFKELQNADLGELAENAKQYARQKPGQALLISAAAGLLLGLILRGRR
jgi:ElaB/YqjD/DUF883 family membrane-anchored ribosome-binding protein